MNAGREEGAVVKATQKKKLHIDENIVPSYVLVNGNRYQWVDCKEDCWGFELFFEGDGTRKRKTISIAPGVSGICLEYVLL